MGVLLSTFRSTLNSLLPFTNPSTPVIQDLIHTAILVLTLYYGPQLVEYYNQNFKDPTPLADPIPDDPPDGALDDLPIDENLILQADSDEEDELPPLAPTPPPGFLAQPPLPPHADWQNGVRGFPEVGPADGNVDPAADRPRPTPANRTIGAKKAKSLARKDQRRAYHEFHRQEAEIRRLRDAEGKEEREAQVAAEKARRAEVEREIQERERGERERKKEEERKEAEEERARRDRVVSRIRQELNEAGAVELIKCAWEEGKDVLWAERLVRASGILSTKGKRGVDGENKAYTVITSGGWVIRIDAQLMANAYADAVSYSNENDGKVSFADLGTILEKVVRARV